MQRIFIYIGSFLLLIAGPVRTHAQERLKLQLGVNAGMPVGDFKDFMGKNSFRGFHGELIYPVAERLRVGLGVSYNDYYEKHPRQIYETKDGTISAVVSNSIQTTPILLKADYDLMAESLIRPYVGLGAGLNLVRYAQYLGEFGDSHTSIKPAVRADLGVNIPFNKEMRTSGITLGANFDLMPYNKNDLGNLNNWGVHLGVFFPLR